MDAFTLMPPLAAILLAISLRNVYVALIAALVLSEGLMMYLAPDMANEAFGEASTNIAVNAAQGVGAGFFGMLDRVVGVFSSTSSTRILLFSLLIGALIAFMRDSGGVTALARAMIGGGIAKSGRRAELAVATTGIAVFIETNVSLLSAGILGRPLYDAHGMSRERLAYIIDSTCAPISVLILFNGWGAYALELIDPYGFEQPVAVVAGTVAMNFYALLTLALVYFTAFSGKVFGPLATANTRTDIRDTDDIPSNGKAIYMWLPLLILVGGALVIMTWTGGGNILNGDGSQAILWSICLAIAILALMLRANGVFTFTALQDRAFKGIGEMVPMVTVLLLSIALGASLKALGTGNYVAGIASQTLPAFTVPAILFAAAGAMSFMTGTSWGTYGILVPIAMPVAMALGLPPSLALAAVLGGGVFGDHCSPISDTTLIASVASGTDHLSHVRTQIPYALVAAIGAIVLYLVVGLVTTSGA